MDPKKLISIMLLIVFLPLAIYTLGTGKLTLFFISAAVVYGLMKLSDYLFKSKWI